MEKVKKRYTVEQEQMARFAKALSHPVRIAILQLLASQECCYHGDMSEVLPVAKSTLSQHLNELKDAGLIQGEITFPSVKYCINQKNCPRIKIICGQSLYSYNHFKKKFYLAVDFFILQRSVF